MRRPLLILALLAFAPFAALTAKAQTSEARSDILSGIAAEVIEAARADDGYVSETSHEAFWATVRAMDCEGCAAETIENPFSETILTKLLPEEIFWWEFYKSVALSLQSREPAATGFMERASASYLESGDQTAEARERRLQIVESVPARLGEAAAGREPDGSGDAIDVGAMGRNILVQTGKVIRLTRLADPKWTASPRPFPIYLAGVVVDWPEPFLPAGQKTVGPYKPYLFTHRTGPETILGILVLPWTEATVAALQADIVAALADQVTAFGPFMETIEPADWNNPAIPPGTPALEGRFGAETEANASYLRLAAFPERGFSLIAIAQDYDTFAEARAALDGLSTAIRFEE